jgi:hypothetical protein
MARMTGHQCNAPECREQFTVTVKTVFERSKVPLSKWLAALFMLTASKKGVSAHQVHRSLGITYKTAWFMMHRLREALRGGASYPFSSDGGAVEADETYIGRIKGEKVRQGRHHKNTVRRFSTAIPNKSAPSMWTVEAGAASVAVELARIMHDFRRGTVTSCRH